MTEANWTHLIGVVLILGTAYIGYLTRKIGYQGQENGVKLDAAHVANNSRFTAMQARIEELSALVGHLQGEASGVARERGRIGQFESSDDRG